MSRQDFKQIYRNVDVLLIDDIQFLAGRGDEFFNALATRSEDRDYLVATMTRFR